MKEASIRLNSKNADQLFKAFRDSYIKSTGKSWTQEKFLQRAGNWEFFGPDDMSGFVAARPQRSGLLKLVGTAGSPRGILAGIKELQSDPERKIWGLVSENLVRPATRHGMLAPHTLPGGHLMLKQLAKKIPSSVTGGVPMTISPRGSAILDYKDVGQAEKFLVGSPAYFSGVMQEQAHVPKFMSNGITGIAGWLGKRASLEKAAEGNSAARRAWSLVEQDPNRLQPILDYVEKMRTFPRESVNNTGYLNLGEIFLDSNEYEKHRSVNRRGVGFAAKYSPEELLARIKKIDPSQGDLPSYLKGEERIQRLDREYRDLLLAKRDAKLRQVRAETPWDQIQRLRTKAEKGESKTRNRRTSKTTGYTVNRYMLKDTPDNPVEAAKLKEEFKNEIAALTPPRETLKRKWAIPVNDLPFNPSKFVYKGTRAANGIDAGSKQLFFSGHPQVSAGAGYGSFFARVKAHRLKNGLPAVVNNIQAISPDTNFFTPHLATIDPESRLRDLTSRGRKWTEPSDVKFDADYKATGRNATWGSSPFYELVADTEERIKPRFKIEGDMAVPFSVKVDRNARRLVTDAFTLGHPSSIVKQVTLPGEGRNTYGKGPGLLEKFKEFTAPAPQSSPQLGRLAGPAGKLKSSLPSGMWSAGGRLGGLLKYIKH